MSEFSMKHTLEKQEYVPITTHSYYSPQVGNKSHHKIYLINDIEVVPLYAKAIQVINESSEGDIIELVLDTYGGYTDTATSLRIALQNCPAKIVVTVLSVAYSAGTMFFDIADEINLSPESSIMMHEYSAGVQGKGQEIKAQQDFYIKRFAKLTDTVYADILTEEEINDLHKGADLYFLGDELAERLAQSGAKVTLR
jgi:ATP-dependent protease ClpP protease subunit